jgi:hypothetical protein
MSRLKKKETKTKEKESMTGPELAALPVGTIVKVDDEEGEIIQAGRTVQILWPSSNLTSVIDTGSKVWDSFIRYLEAE